MSTIIINRPCTYPLNDALPICCHFVGVFAGSIGIYFLNFHGPWYSQFQRRVASFAPSICDNFWYLWKLVSGRLNIGRLLCFIGTPYNPDSIRPQAIDYE